MNKISESDSKVNMAIFWHPLCSEHRIPQHPESYHRVDHILSILKETWTNNEIMFIESNPIKEEQLLLFHTLKLIQTFDKLATYTQDMYQKNKKIKYKSIDMDTQVMWQTKNAAYHAAGAVINAIDKMYIERINDNDNHNFNIRRIDTAFCCIRPPGHHAERDKSCGFCYFNNVGIAAKYAQKKFNVPKVAVLDFDVHHGNGTEEGFADDESLFYGSTHGKGHFPGTGRDPSPWIGEKAKKPIDRRIVNRELTPGPKSRQDFRIKWREILLEMENFQPNLVIMSTGFDAHEDDPLAECELHEDDYEWITTEIIASCQRISIMINSEVRYLSVLEGGYDLPAIERSAISHVKAMLSSYKHLHFTIDLKPIVSIDHLKEIKQENLIDKALNHIISPHLKDDKQTINIINTIKSCLPEDSLSLQDILYDPITNIIVESNTTTNTSNIPGSSDSTSIDSSFINNSNTTLNVPPYTCRKDGEVLALREILEEMGLND